MFTVSSFQNQLYLPISHIASVLGGIHNATSTAVTVPQLLQKHTNQKATSEKDIICHDSFLQMIKNCTELSLREFKHKDVIKKLSDCIKPYMSVKLSSNWRVSHISADTFFENKYGFSENELWESTFGITRTRQLLSTITHHLFQQDVVNALFYQQRRGFKTRQSRLIDKPRLSINIADKIPVLRLLKDSKKADKAKLQSEAEQSERLKTLLSEENLLPEEQQRLKIAFAEGYLSADVKSKTGGTKMRVFSIFRDLMGIVLIIALLVSFMGGPFRRVLIGNSNEVAPEEIDVSFDDVKGVEEAKQELQEIVEFLRNPEKFSALGGKLPKGVLLVGPPGAGKTLLARAVAGEAGVPFFHAAGPEFDEILVGQGARRVRDLFSTAKARAPCVIFIDEIDSVGAKRTSSVLHPYANQTINQLLSEMDGFRQNEGVIVLGATNRRDDLDKALLRPGRFDVEIQVPIPDLKGRKEIIDLYLGKVKVDLDVDIDMLARGTTGFTGADLENMVNQAALRAAIDACTTVNMKYLENSRDKVLMGPERKSRIPDEEANTITAFHEGGHTIVAHYTKDAQPLHKVTIIPRGPSLGHTAYIPEKEYYHTSKAQMLAMLDTLMGGRAAEELIFGSEKVTSGAADDLRRATNLATQMVKNYGMSEKVGVRTFEDNRSTLVVVNDIGQGTAETIDNEIKRILTDSYDRAKHILRTHAKEHKLLAEALLKYETLDAEDIKAIIDGRELRKS